MYSALQLEYLPSRARARARAQMQCTYNMRDLHRMYVLTQIIPDTNLRYKQIQNLLLSFKAFNTQIILKI